MALIDIRDLTFAYPGSYDNVFEHLSLQLDTHWRLGLVGRNGRGKTTLLRLLQRQYEYDGAISVPVPLDCFPSPVSAPERDTLTILEEQEPGLELWRIYKELDMLEVDAGVLFRPYSSLSGGEQVKVLLAALFLREGAFLLLDEPTNHLDLEGRRVVSRYLSRKSGFLLVSHDRAFLDGCVDHIMIINKRDIEVRQGSFSAWWRDKAGPGRLGAGRECPAEAGDRTAGGCRTPHCFLVRPGGGRQRAAATPDFAPTAAISATRRKR